MRSWSKVSILTHARLLKMWLQVARTLLRSSLFLAGSLTARLSSPVPLC